MAKIIKIKNIEPEVVKLLLEKLKDAGYTLTEEELNDVIEIPKNPEHGDFCINWKRLVHKYGRN